MTTEEKNKLVKLAGLKVSDKARDTMLEQRIDTLEKKVGEIVEHLKGLEKPPVKKE